MRLRDSKTRLAKTCRDGYGIVWQAFCPAYIESRFEKPALRDAIILVSRLLKRFVGLHYSILPEGRLSAAIGNR